MKFDPDSDSLPKRAELPEISEAPEGVAWFWGQDVCKQMDVILLRVESAVAPSAGHALCFTSTS